jgi:hypothetical protein
VSDAALEEFVRKLPRLVTLVFAAVVLDTPAASAQNTSFGTSVHMLVGQTPVVVALDTDHFYDAPVVHNRSYCAEATGAEDETQATRPLVFVYRNDMTTQLGVDTGISVEPKGAAASRVCFIAPNDETIFIKVSPFDGTVTNHKHTMRFVETTLWANWYFVAQAYSSFTLLRNTTNTAMTVDIRWIDSSGAQVVALTGQNIAANGVLFIDARAAMGCAYPTACPSIAGSVQVAHSGSPEAIIGSQTTLSGATGLSFDTLFFQRRSW